MGVAHGLYAGTAVARGWFCADTDRSEHLRTAVPRSGFLTDGDRDSRRGRPLAEVPGIGSDVELDRAGRMVCRGDAEPVEEYGDQYLDRRFRHRLLVARVVEAAADRCAEDRSIV